MTRKASLDAQIQQTDNEEGSRRPYAQCRGQGASRTGSGLGEALVTLAAAPWDGAWGHELLEDGGGEVHRGTDV